MRKPFLDNLRWATVVLVVVYHAFYMFNSCGVLGGVGPFSPVQYQDALLPFVYPWFMVLLYVVAGVCARYALERTSPRAFVKGRTLKLLVPSTLGLFVWHWLTGFLNVYLGGGLAYMGEAPTLVRYLIFALSGTGPLWFAQLLWLYSLLLVLLRRLDKGDKLHTLCGKCPAPALLLLFLPLWGAAQVGSLPVITTYRLGIYLMAFLLGYLFLSHDRAQESLSKYHLPLLLAALVFGGAYSYAYFGQDYAAGPLLRGFFTNAYAWLMTLALLGLFKARFDHATPLSSRMTKASFGLYVFHYLPLLLTAWALKTYTPLPALAVYPLTAAAGLFGGLALWQLFRRIPLLRWLLLGLQKPVPSDATP